MEVLGAQAVLVAVLQEPLRRIDHEDALASCRVLLVENDDARRDPRAVEQVRGQADDALDVAAPDNLAADVRLGVAPEQDPVRKDDRALALALQRSK